MTRLNKFLSSLAIVLLIGGCATAAKILYPVNDDPLQSKPGVYTLDSSHANIIFAVNHLGFSLHHGRFNTIEGSLQLDPDVPENSTLYVRIYADSIDINNSKLDEQLKAKSMFYVEEHPFITFESDRVRLTSEKTAIISGTLTLRGVRKAFDIEATFIGSGANPRTGQQTIGFSGKATLVRSEYGLKEWLPLIGDEVFLTIEAEFFRPT